MSPYREHVRTHLPQLLDIGLAATVTAVGLAEVWVPFDSVQGEGARTTSTMGVLAVGLALTQRRRHPFAAGMAVLLTWPLLYLFGPQHILFFGQFVPLAIAVFSMARHGRHRVPAYGAAAGATVLLSIDLFIEELQTPGEIVFHWGVFIIVWCFGFAQSRLERRAQESNRKAIDAEVAAAEQALAAVVAERTRIARELHDIVAHAVSMMVVQAGAAEQVVEDDPEFTRRALEAIRLTGTGALSEMRTVVAMLRDADEPSALAPQPGLAALPSLVEDARSTGLAADLVVVGERRDLPAGLDLAAFRIAQEALTNVRRHARASEVRVVVTYGEDDVLIEVLDDGVGAADTRSGNGLVGMRERASMYGGRVEAGTRDGTGFVVRAVLPAGLSS